MGRNLVPASEGSVCKAGEIICLAFLTEPLEKSSELTDVRTLCDLKMAHGQKGLSLLLACSLHEKVKTLPGDTRKIFTADR